MNPSRAALRVAAIVGSLLPLAAGATAAAGEPPPAPAVSERQILVTFEQRPSRALPGPGSTRRGYSGRGAYETSPRAARLAEKLAREYGLDQVDGWPIELLDVHCVLYEIPPGRSAAEVVAELERDPRVASVQRMQWFEVLGRSSWDDPHFSLQHGLHEMQVEEAHRWALGRGVRVAVVDTGVDLGHPELDGRIALAENFVDDDLLAFSRDQHGTAVAGIIASRAGNGIGIVGVAPSVRLLALKACWEASGEASPAVCSTFTLAKAISFAVRRQADVINLSLTGPADPLLAALLSKAIDRGVVVVSASAPGLDRGFPASLERVIAVASAGGGDSGLSAPGEDVLTIRPGGAYDFMSGSSLAAAHVTGVAALMLEGRPRLSNEALHRVLRETARPAGGAAAVNACAALAELLGTAGCELTDTDGTEARPTPGT